MNCVAVRGSLEVYRLLVDNITGNKNFRDLEGWTPPHDAFTELQEIEIAVFDERDGKPY